MKYLSTFILLIKLVNKLLTPAEKDFLITELAHERKLEPALLRAIVDIESSGQGFYSKDHEFSNKCKVRFEPDFFQRFASTRPFFLPASISIESAKKDSRFTGRKAYEQAILQSPSSAIKATSFGLGQILGMNYKIVGFNSLIEFSNAMENSEYQQLEALVRFISSNTSLLIAAREINFVEIARLYNGPNYLSRGYDRKLADAYKILKRKKMVTA